MLKKIISSILAVAMLVCMSTSVFAFNNEAGELYDYFENIVNSESEREIMHRTVSSYLNDEQFILHLAEDKIEAISMVENVIKSEIRKSKLRSNWYDGAYDVSVPEIIQRTKTSCGAASTVQAIYSKGYDGKIPGETTTDKQIQLEKDTGIYNTTNGAMVYKVAGGINKYTNPYVGMVNSKYSYVEMTKVSKENFKQRIVESMLSGGSPILHAIPKYLTSYYPSTSTTGH